MERVDLAGPFSEPGAPHGPPGAPSSPVRHDVAGPALKIPLADDRPNARRSAPSSLLPPAGSAQLPAAGDASNRPGQEVTADP